MQTAGQKIWAPVLCVALVFLFPTPAQTQVASPKRLRFKILSATRLHVSWKEPRGDFDSYKVIYSTQPGGKEKEVQVSKTEGKMVIEDYNPSKEYHFKIFALSGAGESSPVEAKYKAQRTDPGSESVQPQTQKDPGAAEDNEIAQGNSRWET